MNKYLVSYFLILNLITYFIYFFDKKQAKSNNYRISEKILLTIVLLGGTIGALSSMLVHRHKIKKISFILKYILANIFFIYLLFYQLEEYL